MNLISNILQVLKISIVGTPTPDKSRILNKKLTPREQREEYRFRVNLWITRNFGLIALAAILILLAVFCIVCYMLVGVSATDSGLVYNQMETII